MPVISQFSLQARMLVPGWSFELSIIGLYHPLDDITNPKCKLLHFFTITFFNKEKKALAFNRDRCCHLVLCLRLIMGKAKAYPRKAHCRRTTLGLAPGLTHKY
jgi:hypothetical protein